MLYKKNYEWRYLHAPVWGLDCLTPITCVIFPFQGCVTFSIYLIVEQSKSTPAHLNTYCTNTGECFHPCHSDQTKIMMDIIFPYGSEILITNLLLIEFERKGVTLPPTLINRQVIWDVQCREQQQDVLRGQFRHSLGSLQFSVIRSVHVSKPGAREGAAVARPSDCGRGDRVWWIRERCLHLKWLGNGYSSI